MAIATLTPRALAAALMETRLRRFAGGSTAVLEPAARVTSRH